MDMGENCGGREGGGRRVKGGVGMWGGGGGGGGRVNDLELQVVQI